MAEIIDTLAQEIAARTPLDAAQARTVLAGAFALIRKHAKADKVEALFAHIPGVEGLVAEAPPLPKAGLLGGMMKAAGGGALADGMAMLQSLSAHGVGSADLQKALPVAMQWLEGHAGSDVLGEALASIPGAGGLLSRG